MESITFLEKNIISNFVNFLKSVENKKIILIENGKYIPFFEIDNKNNKFEINIEYMIKNEGKNKFEINNKHYKQISSFILRKITTIDASKKFYRELLTLCYYLFQYKIKVKNLKKCKSPDFFIEEENGKTYLIEIFISKDEYAWCKDNSILEWSLLNSYEDINKTNLKLNENLNLNENLHLIENSISNLKLEKARSKTNLNTLKFNYTEALKSVNTHLKKLEKYNENKKNINNLVLLIQMGFDIDKEDMYNFSQKIILETSNKKYNFYNFKIKVILINEFDNYDFFLN